MKRLHFRYQLKAEYSQPVRHHSFSVRFLPSDTSRQRVERMEAEISGCETFGNAEDSFGNRRVYGTIEAPHDVFNVEIRGTVLTGTDIYEEYTADPHRCAMFKAQTQLTQPGDLIRQFGAEFSFSDADGPYDRVLAVMRRLHERFSYGPGRTKAHEKAESALAAGAGVCQDYAHIMLSLLREQDIPARYVVGMMPGEGASHAWVEALCRGYWYGFDPTNGRLVDDDYIRVSCGRDSLDCAVIRGSFTGAAGQSQSEIVQVEEIFRET